MKQVVSFHAIEPRRSLRPQSSVALLRRVTASEHQLGRPSLKQESTIGLISESENFVARRKRNLKLLKKSGKRDYGKLGTSEYACKRVIAPYVNIIRRGRRAVVKVDQEDDVAWIRLRIKPSFVMKGLREFLDDKLDLNLLLHETADSLKDVTQAQTVRIYMVDQTSNEIYISNRQASSHTRRICWKVEKGKTVAAHVACTMEPVIVEDIIADARFPDGIAYTDTMTKSVICVPVVTPNKECQAVIELFRDITQPRFRSNEFKITNTVANLVGAAIFTNLQRIMLDSEKQLNDCLVDLARCYFTDTYMFDKLILQLINFVRTSMNAQRATFYVIDEDKEDLVTGIFDDSNEPSDEITKRDLRINFCREGSIARYVAVTGEPLNINDAFNDPRFNVELDKRTGMITRSVLCMPIKGIKGIIGVVQATNKIEGRGFTRQDELIFNTSSTFYGLALHYYHVSRGSIQAEAKSEVTWGVIRRQAHPCPHELEYTMKNLRIYENPRAIQQYSWYVSLEHLENTPQIAVHMIMNIGRDAMNKPEVVKLVLTLRRFYRNVGYHNWEHGFNVCHCMYNLLLRNSDRFTHSERKALMIATLAHDVDHGGVTNNFLVTSNDVMWSLYEDSPWESHHYFVLMQMLMEIHVFQDITPEDFKFVSGVMKHAILSTDLAFYFRVRQKLMPIVNDGEFTWDDHDHKYMALSIMMTICDLSGQCKSFKVAKRLTDNLYLEFYAQGDRERDMGLQPLSLMDRTKEYYQPEDQVTFISVLVLPCADLIRKLMKDSESLYEVASKLCDDWREIIKMRDTRCWRQADSLVDSVDKNDSKK
ncbi:hypothetical protein Trydic_g19371 [Trypoxylus dichotomus]